MVFVMPWHISERGGGAEVQANYLSQALARRGFQVSYVCQTVNLNKINSIEILNEVQVHWLKSSGRFHWVDQNKYLTKLKSIQPHVVVQRLSSNVSYVIGNYCTDNSCKFVWICTDNISPYKNYHVRKFKKSNELRSIGFIKYYSFFLNAKIMDKLRNRGMRNIDIAFTQNNEQYHILEQEFNIKSERMISGHQKPEAISNSKTRFNERTIIWCGNFGKNKRPKLFVELTIALQNENIKFIMIGGHSDSAYVKEVLEDKPEALHVTGQVSFEESLNCFDNASLLVNTSVLEGFSNTYIQAWLRGVPTVVFGADPNEVIQKNNLGYVTDNVDDARNFINSLFEDFGSYETMSENVKRYAIDNHTIDKMTDSFLKSIDVS
mgnify:CR=1 FL=1